MSFQSILAPLWFTPKLLRMRVSSRRAGFCPRLEPLENRTVPTTFTVLNRADEGAGSLRQIVESANTQAGADTIQFADGLVGTIALTRELNITDDLTIDGPGAGLLAVNGNHQSRIFNIISGKTVAIDDLTIADGQVVGDGGGILNTGSNLTLDRVVLTGNHAVAATGNANGRGGAVANLSSATLTVTDCQFIENQARGGGPPGTGGPLFVRCGAGILNANSFLTVSRSTFIGNLAIGGSGGVRGQGGGINSIQGSTATVTDCTFVGNQGIAGDGGSGPGLGRAGALFNDASTMTVVDCLIEGNVARGGSNITAGGLLAVSGGGGGIFNSDRGVLSLIGCVVRGNQAIGGSGNTCTFGNAEIGTAFGGGLGNLATATITDCVFEDNEARGGHGNKGSGSGFQFVGTALGGAIVTACKNTSGTPASLILDNVTIRNNRAIGGDGNTAGTFMNAGFGGGLANNGSNPFAAPGGSTITLRHSTVAQNQAIGGSGGAALGGGVANLLGGAVNIGGSTLTHNRAQGGAGGSGLGGGIYNAAASADPSNFGASTKLTVKASSITHNKAQGGDASGSAGSGIGGGVWNGGTTSVFDTFISHNLALGGDGTDGGDGLGGGMYNDASASLWLERTTVTRNHANGGEGGDDGLGGEGIGGGIYNLGAFGFDVLNLIENHASTSHDELFDHDA